MSGTVDKAKGRIKEAAGALTGDRKLKREGQIDQAAGDVKDAADPRRRAGEELAQTAEVSSREGSACRALPEPRVNEPR